MEGQLYNDSRTGFVEDENLPVLAQVAQGEINFHLKGKQLVIFPLNVSGEKRMQSI